MFLVNPFTEPGSKITLAFPLKRVIVVLLLGAQAPGLIFEKLENEMNGWKEGSQKPSLRKPLAGEHDRQSCTD